MKDVFKIGLLSSLLMLSSAALADPTSPIPGIYFGLQAGVGNTHYSTSDVFPTTITNAKLSGNNGWAGRFYAGYQFYGTNLSAELGYTYFRPIKASGNGNAIPSGSIIEQAFDLVGKYTFPVSTDFNIYGKLGGAFLVADPKLNLSCSNQATCNQINNGGNLKLYGDSIQQRLLPTASLGLSYNITPNVPMDISWTRIQKIGNSNLKSTDLIGLGIAYIIGE